MQLYNLLITELWSAARACTSTTQSNVSSGNNSSRHQSSCNQGVAISYNVEHLNPVVTIRQQHEACVQQ
jgi:hypothetical protein